MSKKINNKTLLYILCGLLILFGIVKWYQKAKVDKTLVTEIVKIDTAKVTEILLYPTSEKGAEIRFSRDGKNWKVQKANIIAETEEATIKGLLTSLQELKVKNLMTKDKNKWAEYHVNDSLATKVKIKAGKKITANLYIGRFSYQPSQRGYGMYGGGGVTGTTYVRLANQNEVYGVDGFLVFTFNQSFNMFRKQSIARFETNQIDKISFKYPADSSFTLELKNNKWLINDIPADSSKVAAYLNRLSYKSSTNFNDQFKVQSNPLYEVIFEGKSIKPIVIDAYLYANDTLVVNSSINPKANFTFDKKSLEEIFAGKSAFLNISSKK